MKKLLSVFIILIVLAGAKLSMRPEKVYAQNMFWSFNYPTGLLGWWKLCGDTSASGGCVPSSSTAVYDSSGYAQSGTWNGAQSGTAYWYSAGHVGPYAGTFDGTDNYVNTGAVNFNINTGDFTVTAWIYPTSYMVGETTGPTVVSFGSYAPYFGIDSNQPGNNDSLSFYWAGWHRFNTPVTLNAWHFVVLERASGVVSAYLDGVKEATTYSMAGTSLANGIVLWTGYDGAGDWYAGRIDDVRIYNRALSAGEIAQMYLAHN